MCQILQLNYRQWPLTVVGLGPAQPLSIKVHIRIITPEYFFIFSPCQNFPFISDIRLVNFVYDIS